MTNVLLIMTDQQRADSLGCTGNAVARTPNIDMLAARGAVFRNHFTPHQICSPSRATLFTGMLARNHGLTRSYPHQVSGGQLQRAMTAMALVCQPDIVIFDEPTTALDVTTQVEVLTAIKQAVRNHGIAAIYITHDLAMVAQLADRIKVLLKGEEIEEAPAATMIDAPREDYTKSLWAVRTFRKKTVAPTVASGAGAGGRPAPVLEVSCLSANYGVVRVLDDVSFSMAPGTTLAVVGESGSGKTTVARAICGLLKPMAGEVRFRDQVLPAQLSRRTIEQMRQIQMIYQSPDTALNPRQTVDDIISRPSERLLGLSRKASVKRAHEILRLIGMEPADFSDHRPGQLSGGQKQRISIARALAAEPKIIICDEITSSLDQIVAEDILKLLDSVQSQLSTAFLYITHDLDTVRAVADDVLVMQKGRVVRHGPRQQALAPPFDPYTQTLLDSVPEMRVGWLDDLISARKATDASWQSNST